MGSVPGESVGKASDEEVRVQLPGKAEQLPDIAFAIANVNAARGIGQPFGGLAQIVCLTHRGHAILGSPKPGAKYHIAHRR